MNIIKMIKSENNNGFISNDTFGTNSLTFNIDLPKNAAVDHIRIKGEFNEDIFGTLKDVMLEDIPCVNITYHREMAFEAYNPNRMQRVAGTVYNVPSDLYTKVQGGVISHFNVYYHEEAVVEVE